MATNSITVRIRGPYATALTKILFDEGYEIVQASEPIQKRFSVTFNPKPADVTVKSDEERPNILLLIGSHTKTSLLSSTIKKKTGLIYSQESLVDQYSTIALTIIEKGSNGCIGTFSNLKVQVETEECVAGKVLPAVVITPVFRQQETMKAKKGLALYTPLYTLFSWKQTSISEHIRDRKVIDELLGLSQQILNEGLGIKWSSNSAYVSLSELKEMLANDIDKLRKTMKQNVFEPDKVISEGRRIVKLYSNTQSDLVMDYARSAVTPTAPAHHTLKTLSKDLDLIIDFAEKTMEIYPESSQLIRSAFRKFINEKLVGAKKIFIRHRKLNGNEFLIGPFQIREAKEDVIMLQRYIKSPGYYDGINVKKEPGDIGLTITSYQSNIVMHIYFSINGELKGVYVNVNTPVIFGWDSIIYDDLELDVVYSPIMGVKLQDEELLRHVLMEGGIRDDIQNMILSYAYEIKKRVENNIKLLPEPISFYEKIALQKAQPELLTQYLKQE
jgi:hypothetical protein